MGYMRDYAGRRLDAFQPVRDLPAVLGHWDASALPGAIGSAPTTLPDRTTNGYHLVQNTTAKQGIIAAGPNGLKVVDLGASGYYARTTIGSGDWLTPSAGFAQPITFLAVVKCPNTAPTASARQVMHGGGLYMGSSINTGSSYLYAGTTTITGGRNVLDGEWHVLAAVITANGTALFLDGYLVASSVNASGTGALTGLAVGASTAGANPLGGLFAEGIACNAALTFQQVAKASAALGAKWGITIGPQQSIPTHQQTTQPNGQTARIWEPPTLAAGAPLVIYCHNYTGNEQIAPNAGGWAFPLVTASLAEGWRVAASNQHGNSWGNQASVDDLVDLYTMMNARQAVTKVVLIGSSMGGVSATLAVPDGRIPIKGVALQDAVTNIADVYTPQTGFQDYSGTINTAHGITAYNQLAAGRDPNTRPASDFTGVRWRIYQSTTDATNVNPANNGNTWATKVAAAPEAALITHLGGHLATDVARPGDFVAFVKRCIA